MFFKEVIIIQSFSMRFKWVLNCALDLGYFCRNIWHFAGACVINASPFLIITVHDSLSDQNYSLVSRE